MRFLKYIFDLIFPSICFCCKEDLEPLRRHPLCSLCEKKLRFISFPYCILCGKDLEGGGNICYSCKNRKYNFDFSRSVFEYNDAIASIIKAYKYDKKDYLSEWLGRVMSERFGYYKEFNNIDLVTYIPSTKKKIKERGFDHARLIAEAFSKNTGIIMIGDVIESIKDISQVELSAEMRRKNVEGKFKLKKTAFKGKRVLLIDDVSTTLSTLNEVSKIIRCDGALSVFCYTVAREHL